MLLTTSQAASCERCSRCRDCCTGGTKAKGGRGIVRFCELRRLVGLLLVGALLVSRLSRLGRHNGVCILGPFAEQRHGSCKLGTIVPFGSAVFIGIPTIERPTIDRLLFLGDIGGTNFKVGIGIRESGALGSVTDILVIDAQQAVGSLECNRSFFRLVSTRLSGLYMLGLAMGGPARVFRIDIPTIDCMTATFKIGKHVVMRSAEGVAPPFST